jgi:hypothetical protein
MEPKLILGPMVQVNHPLKLSLVRIKTIREMLFCTRLYRGVLRARANPLMTVKLLSKLFARCCWKRCSLVENLTKLMIVGLRSI